MYSTAKLYLSLMLPLLMFVAGCGDGYGEKIVVDGTEIYYDGESATKADAEKLGETLKSSGFTDGQEKAVQLQRKEGRYIFRMVTQDQYLNSDEIELDMQMMCLQLSGVFDGAAVDCHACNEFLETQKEVSGLSGKLMSVGKSELYYGDVTEDQLAEINAVLTGLGFEEAETSLYFGKVDGAYQFRMVCSEEFFDDEELHNESKIWQDRLSTAVGGQPVVVMLCDAYFQPKFTRTVE